MKKFRIAFAGLVALLVALLAPGMASAAVAPVEAAPAPLPPGIQAQLQNAPTNVNTWVHGIAAKGGKVLSLKEANYQLKTKPGTAAPAGYPTGCGLWVTIYQQVNAGPDDVISSNLSSCTMEVEEIDMNSGLAIWQGGGWNEVASDHDNNHLVESFALDYGYTCNNSNSNTWQTVTSGLIETLDGNEYTADAYDWGNFNCGV